MFPCRWGRRERPLCTAQVTEWKIFRPPAPCGLKRTTEVPALPLRMRQRNPEHRRDPVSRFQIVTAVIRNSPVSIMPGKTGRTAMRSASFTTGAISAIPQGRRFGEAELSVRRPTCRRPEGGGVFCFHRRPVLIIQANSRRVTVLSDGF